MANFTLRIEQDCDAGNPRKEFDCLGELRVDDVQGLIDPSDDGAHYWYGPEETFAELRRDRTLYLPVRYDGSIFVTDEADATGFIMVTRAAVLKEWSVKIVTARVRAAALSCFRNEIETLNNWLNGEVYGYIVEETETGETADSCWGFYGGLDYARQEGTAALRYAEEEARRASFADAPIPSFA